MNNNLLLFILTLAIYIYINIYHVSSNVIMVYNNPLVKITFLLSLLFFGKNNIQLILYLAINYVYLGQIISEQELMKNL